MKKNRTIIESFKNAFSGLGTMVKEERNIKIELLTGGAALYLCGFFRVTKEELLSVILCCALVLSLECVNTAIEQVVNLASPDYHELARRGKDFAAGAVVLGAFFAVVVGVIVFLPYIIRYSSAIHS